MKIEDLISKYLEGETTPEEEKYLREYFSKEDVTAELVHYKYLFGFYAEEKNYELSKDFDNRLLESINKTNVIKLRNYRPILRYSAIAASILIIFGLTYYFVYMNHNEIKSNKVLITEKQIKGTNSTEIQTPVEVKTKINPIKSIGIAKTFTKTSPTAKHYRKLTPDEKFAFTKTRQALNVAFSELEKNEKKMNKISPFDNAIQDINRHSKFDETINKIKSIIGG